MWIVVHLMVLLDVGIPLNQAAADSVISNLVLAAMCLLVINNMRYYLPRKEKYLYICIISIVLSAIWLLLVRVSLWALYKTDLGYTIAVLIVVHTGTGHPRIEWSEIAKG